MNPLEYRWRWEVLGSSNHPSRLGFTRNGYTLTKIGATIQAERWRRRLTRAGYDVVTYTQRA